MSKNIPAPVQITADQHRKLLGSNDALQAIQQTMQLFQQTCEQRMATVQANVRSTWAEIAQQHGIDMKNVVWEPHPSQPMIVPTQMRINE